LTEKARSFYSLVVAIPEPRHESLRRTAGIDHVTLGVREHAASRRFYERGLRPLGFRIRFDWPEGGLLCLGPASGPSSLWLERGLPTGARVSLAAVDRAAVDAFHAEAVAAGGTALAPPGLRPQYTASTYAAEVLDPDGNRIEAICRRPEPDPETARAAA
jgi:catechol 2,3-dioxygenase-like lactoylglutathione lyase family enzyme